MSKLYRQFQRENEMYRFIPGEKSFFSARRENKGNSKNEEEKCTCKWENKYSSDLFLLCDKCLLEAIEDMERKSK